MRGLLALAGLVSVAVLLAPAAPPRPAPEVVARKVPAIQYTPQRLVDVAYEDATAVAAKGVDPRYYRYLWAGHKVTQEGREAQERQVAFVTNQLNFKGRLLAKPTVLDEGRVLRIDLQALHIDPKVWDEFIATGSSKAAFPEPYFHFLKTVVEKKVVEKTRKVKRVWPGGADKSGREFPKGYEYEVEERYEEVLAEKQSEQLVRALHLQQEKALKLEQLLHTDFALARSDWVINYALRPPFYLKFQGGPKKLADLERLAGLKRNDRAGTQLYGAVLFSEVAGANRRTERIPLESNYGRGSWHQTFDFFTSIRRQNVLKDVLIDTADAGEIFWTLPNGLWGWALIDGQGNVIDVADPRIALNNRTYVHLKAVEQGWSCITCHPRGPLLVADEVRLTGRDTIALLDTKVKDHARQEKIADRYFGEEYNRLLIADQENYEAAVKALCDLGAAAVSLEYEREVWEYQDRPLGPEDVAIETGYPLETMLTVFDAGAKVGLDQTFVRMLKGRKGRRDQFEEAFAQLMAYLVLSEEIGP